jgi:hypothetical protein
VGIAAKEKRAGWDHDYLLKFWPKLDAIALGNDGLNHAHLYKPIGSLSHRLSPPSWTHSQAAHDTYIRMSVTGRLILTWLKSLAIVARNFTVSTIAEAMSSSGNSWTLHITCDYR